MQVHKSKHLSRKKQIQLGSYYTPKKLVDVVFEFIRPTLAKQKKAVIFDSAAGCGAFIMDMKKYDYRAADYDGKAISFLRKHLDKSKVFYSNSLVDMSRKKYDIPETAFLVMVGNPPYNDTTSEFKSGQKGKNVADSDLFDRDIGVSFLKSYAKLEADLVCVLHPLSYLIKETNFKRLKSFKDNYRLVRGVIFSSSWFDSTGSMKFPVMIGLYVKDKGGMSYEHIRKFKFDILESKKKFVLADYQTTDGFINKYPPRSGDTKISPIGLYYYTFRDFNSLRKNASFLTKPGPNTIVVTLDNFYKYAYLHALKNLFQPKNPWLYGNLSPLVDPEKVIKHKKDYVEYALATSAAVKGLRRKDLRKLMKHYGLGKVRSVGVLEESVKGDFGVVNNYN